MISIIVITHGQFGQELLRTAQDIAGRQDAVAALSVTPDMGLDNVTQALGETIERLTSPEGALILVDMLGGTPCNTALLKTKDLHAEVLTGRESLHDSFQLYTSRQHGFENARGQSG